MRCRRLMIHRHTFYSLYSQACALEGLDRLGCLALVATKLCDRAMRNGGNFDHLRALAQLRRTNQIFACHIQLLALVRQFSLPN